MAGTLDIIAIVYAYLLAFIILGIIVLIVKASTSFAAKRGERPQGHPPKVPEVKPEVAGEATAPPAPTVDHAKIAAAVAAVAAHLSRRGIELVEGALQPSRYAHNLWVLQWRSQASRSPNELCLIKFSYKRV